MVNNENKKREAGAQSQRNKDEYFTFRSNEKEEKITQMRQMMKKVYTYE